MEGLLLTLGGLLLLSGFFSGSETAFFSLSPERIGRLEKSAIARDRSIIRLLRDPSAFLATILLGNLAINVLYFSLAAAAVSRFDSDLTKLGLALVFLLTIVVCGEIIPKTFALGHPLALARFASFPLVTFHLLCLPIRKVLNFFTGWFFRRLESESGESRLLQPEEAARVIHGRAAHFGLDVRTAGFLREVVELSDIRVREVMIPRVDVPCFDLDDGITALRQLMAEKQYSWVLVYRDQLDNALGVVLARRVFLEKRDLPLLERLEQVPVVPEVGSLEGALRTFRATGVSRALVVDEYGGLAGVLTEELLAEEIVGELSAEYEKPGDEIRRLGENSWHLEGVLSLREWAEHFLIKAELPGNIETVGGFVTSLLGEIPTAGKQARFGSYLFTISKVRKKRIILLAMTRVGSSGEDQG